MLSVFVKHKLVVWMQKKLVMQIEHQTKKLLAKQHILQANDDDDNGKDATCAWKKHNNQPDCGMCQSSGVKCSVCVDDDHDDSDKNDSDEEDIEEEDEEKEKKWFALCMTMMLTIITMTTLRHLFFCTFVVSKMCSIICCCCSLSLFETNVNEWQQQMIEHVFGAMNMQQNRCLSIVIVTIINSIFMHITNQFFSSSSSSSMFSPSLSFSPPPSSSST